MWLHEVPGGRDGDHLSACTTHSVKKAHDWVVDQLTDFFRTTHSVKTQHVTKRSSSDLNLNEHLHYPNDIDRSLNESVSDKIRKYRPDYNNNPPNPTSFIPVIVSTSGRLFCETLFLTCPSQMSTFWGY